MNIADILTPSEMAQFEAFLAGEIEQINKAEMEARATISQQFNRARLGARRVALSRVLGPSADPIPPAYADRCEACGAEVCDCEPLAHQPEPPSHHKELTAFDTAPEGLLVSKEATKLVGKGRSTLSNWVSHGWLAPAGYLRSGNKPAQWPHLFRREDLQAAAERAKEGGIVRREKTASAFAEVDRKAAAKAARRVDLPEGWITITDAAKLADRHPSSINNWIKDNLIEARQTRDQVGVRWIVKQSSILAHVRRIAKGGESKTGPKPAPTKKEPDAVPLPALFIPSEEKQLARRFRVHDIVPAPPVRQPVPKVVIPAPQLDMNEKGRFEAEEYGKALMARGFWLLCRVIDGRMEYLATESESKQGWEPVERWTRNGLGRWESCPADPGAVGFGNGTTTGPKKVLTPGGAL